MPCMPGRARSSRNGLPRTKPRSVLQESRSKIRNGCSHGWNESLPKRKPSHVQRAKALPVMTVRRRLERELAEAQADARAAREDVAGHDRTHERLECELAASASQRARSERRRCRTCPDARAAGTSACRGGSPSAGSERTAGEGSARAQTCRAGTRRITGRSAAARERSADAKAQSELAEQIAHEKRDPRSRTKSPGMTTLGPRSRRKSPSIKGPIHARGAACARATCSAGGQARLGSRCASWKRPRARTAKRLRARPRASGTGNADRERTAGSGCGPAGGHRSYRRTEGRRSNRSRRPHTSGRLRSRISRRSLRTNGASASRRTHRPNPSGRRTRSCARRSRICERPPRIKLVPMTKRWRGARNSTLGSRRFRPRTESSAATWRSMCRCGWNWNRSFARRVRPASVRKRMRLRKKRKRSEVEQKLRDEHEGRERAEAHAAAEERSRNDSRAAASRGA